MNPKRIVITRRRNEWWDPASDFNTAPGRLVNVQGRVVAVDPFLTSPNVVVGITIPGASGPIYLRPGEKLTFPEKLDQVHVFNPIHRQLGMHVVASVAAANYVIPLGTVALLSGSETDLVAWSPRANRTRPSPVAALLAHGTLPATMDTLAVHVPCSGLEKIRVRVVPCGGADVLVTGATMPAGLAGMLRVAQVEVLPCGNGSTVYDVAASLIPDPDAGHGPIEYGATAAITYALDALSNFTIDATQTEQDFEVGAGGLLNLSLTGLAGAGVTSARAFVTGS